MTDSPDLRLVGAFNSHQPGALCDRFESHTHMADGSIRMPAEFTPHPGEQHQFESKCIKCGGWGQLFVAILGPDEQGAIVPVNPHGE